MDILLFELATLCPPSLDREIVYISKKKFDKFKKIKMKYFYRISHKIKMTTIDMTVIMLIHINTRPIVIACSR